MCSPGTARLRKLSWTNRAHVLLLLFFTMSIASQAQTFTTLHSFDATDGSLPYAGLIQGTNGDLYGTTFYGGANSCIINGVNQGCGTVFRITSRGVLTMLHSFDGTDGSFPYGDLVLAPNGDFYGITDGGGANSCVTSGVDYGCGTVFKITPSGKLTTIYNFCSQTGCTDGESPLGLTQANSGDFYGTTFGGGTNGYGTVFKITPNGTLTTLHSFDLTDGDGPYAGPVQGTDGNLYGTTEFGGANAVDGGTGYGTVYKITPGGTLTTLHSFDLTDGFLLFGGLVEAANGDFYGPTLVGGANDSGTIFRITPSGTLTTLYSFCSESACADGSQPWAGLVEATNGSFYGTTNAGGANSCALYGLDSGCGTIFQITPSGSLTNLYSFCTQSACADGYLPYGVLVQATNGNSTGQPSTAGRTVMARSSAFLWDWDRLWRHCLRPAKWEQPSRFWGPS